jgi:creatinase/prolidase-like protein
MKRGLVVLDHDEVPEAEWRGRLDQPRRMLAERGIDLALIYGDVFRSDDIAYLTNLCIYWNEGMLAVPADGEPTLLTKLSPRVHPWMRRTSTLTDLRSGKTFGALVGTLLAERPPGTLGLIDAGLWPAALVDEVAGAAPGWTVVPLDGLVRDRRSRPSERQLGLLRRGSGVLTDAVAQAARAGLSEPERVATAERTVRSAGFTDVLVRAAGGSVEITGQYRNGWLRVGRDVDGRATPALRGAVSMAAGGVRVAELAAAARAQLAGLPAGSACEVRVVDHADLSTDGEYAGRDPDRTLAAGTVVAICVEVTTPDGPPLAASDTVLVHERGAEQLTGAVARR